MMMNLFSLFDPSTIFTWPMNWTSSIMPLIFSPFTMWLIPNNYFIIWKTTTNALLNEFKSIINNSWNTTSALIIMISMFSMILINNLMGLFSYIFTATSHLVFNLTFGLTLWMSLMIFGWMNTNKNMLIHLVPMGTPNILIPFMICIEIISNLMRPLTLSIRLTANMIAGHLLLTLLGNLGPTIMTSFIPVFMMIQFLLFMLESAVAIIQAYVFTVLVTLYFSEIYNSY